MLINDSRLLDIVEDLIGPDIRLIHYQGLYKPPDSGGEVGWHQDNHYFDVEDNKTVSVWMALDDATVENGACGISRDSNPNRWRTRNSGTPRRRRFYFAIRDL